MSRVFICAQANFPRGGAEANYIQYLALALKDAGCDVFIFSRGKNREEDWDREANKNSFQGISYDNDDRSYVGITGYIKRYIVEKQEIIKKLKAMKPCENDFVILYSVNYFYIRAIYRYCKAKKVKVTTCTTEWHQSFQYKWGICNPTYWLEWLGFHFGIPMTKNVFPISSHLEKYFKKRGCRTLCLPIMADSSEFPFKREVNTDGKIHFIYSGNPLKKDAMDIMLKAFSNLDAVEKKKVLFHLCGIGNKSLQELKKKYKKEMSQLKDVLVIHEWMEYEKLVELYQTMDFLLIARRKNRVTMSNFPSKIPEMMSFGIIPVVSEVGDYTKKYLKNNDNSIVFHECTEKECGAAIIRALHMDEKEKRIMRQHARETVEEKFDYRNWEKKIYQWLAD